jgi:hypothetical protein
VRAESPTIGTTVAEKTARLASAPLWRTAALLPIDRNEQLAVLHEKESARGNKNRATLAVARKLVEFMLAIDRRGSDFELLKKATEVLAKRFSISLNRPY